METAADIRKAIDYAVTAAACRRAARIEPEARHAWTTLADEQTMESRRALQRFVGMEMLSASEPDEAAGARAIALRGAVGDAGLE